MLWIDRRAEGVEFLDPSGPDVNRVERPGFHYLEQGLTCPPPVEGDAYSASEAPALPRSLLEAVERFGASALARESFGSEFVEHCVRMRQWEVGHVTERLRTVNPSTSAHRPGSGERRAGCSADRCRVQGRPE